MQCVEDDSIYVQGDPFAWNSDAYVEISFEECDEFDGIECGSEKSIKDWTDNHYLDIVLDYEQVDMQSRDEPIYTYR